MKLNYATREVDSSQALFTKNITIQSNAKAFRVLFERIYPDIIKAIVRELFTNAWDSQKVAGTLDIPIDIHIPTTFEPYFSIRDYGVGMTPELINDIYTNMFVSSKDTSNEEAGLFGLGSKTPLGLCDSFTLMSYIDGIYWYYEIFLNETGVPVLSLKATGETDEPNGVYVQLPVSSENFDQFKSHTELFAFGANTPININKEKYLEKYEITSSGKNWELVKSSKITSMHVRMGCVLYKLDANMLSNLGLILDNRNYYHSTKNIVNNTPLILLFDIGDFEVTASREDIVYNKESVQKIQNKLVEAKSEFSDAISKQIKTAKCFYNAAKILQDNSELFLFDNDKRYKYKSLNVKKTNVINFKALNLDCYYKTTGYSRTLLKKQESWSFPHHYRDINTVIYKKKDEKVKHEKARIKNISLKRNGLYEGQIIYVEYKNEFSLKKLEVYLPKSAIWINLKDVEPYVEEKRGKFSEEDRAHVLNLTFPTNFSFFNYNSMINVEKGMFYVEASRNKLHDEEKIIKACEFFQEQRIKLTVVVILRGQTNFISKYDLKPFLKHYEEKTKNLKYDDVIITVNAANKVVEISDKRRNLLATKFFLDNYFLKEFPNYKTTLSTKAFDENLNQTIYNDFQKKYKEIEEFFLKFEQENKILEFISNYDIRCNLEKIMKTIEEMKK